MVMFKGEDITLRQIAEEHKLPYKLVKSRHKEGFKDDDLLPKHHMGSGSENAATKLDIEKVEEIKKLLLISDLTQTDIAKRYNIDPSHVSDIKRGKRWGKVIVDVEKIIPED